MVLEKTVSNYGRAVYSSMIFIGLALLDVFVAVITIGFRRFLNYSSLRAISMLSGLTLLGSGLYFG